MGVFENGRPASGSGVVNQAVDTYAVAAAASVAIVAAWAR
jgi:hypothetical protein